MIEATKAEASAATHGERGGRQAPVRGTQSFVAVMAAVWKRPSLTGLELLWRWGVGAPLLAVAVWETMRIGRMVTVNWAELQSMTVFQPVAVFRTIGSAVHAVAPAAGPVLEWLLPLAVVVWIAAGALGRAMVMRRLDGHLRARARTLLALGSLRVVSLAAVWLLWFCGVRWAGSVAITGPAQRGAESSVIVYCALLISGTLALFMAWAWASWMLHLAPLEALLLGPKAGIAQTLRATLHSGRLRGKLIETNLVMGIVKIAVLVLAMVLSASPLAFTTVQTQAFLKDWWCFVVVVYLAAIDYFHVVHAAAYVALWQETKDEQPEREQR